MPKITLMIGHLCQGGAERVCVNLANEFSILGYKVEVVVFSLKEVVFSKELNKSIQLTCLNIESNKSALWKLCKYLINTKPSHIISFNYHISFFLFLLKNFFYFKLFSRSISTLSENFKDRNSLIDKVKLQMLIFSLQKSDKVIAQSNGMSNDLIQLGIDKNKVITINNPIHPKYFINSELKQEENYILFVGRLSKEKAVHYIIKMMRNISIQYKLFIIGEGVQQRQLQTLVKDLQLEQRVKFLGHRQNVENFLQKARCTVLSSIYEGFPNILVESIACGTPVVSFDCPNGPSEIIIEGVNGYLSKYLDVDDLAKKVNKVLSTNFESTLVKRSAQRYHFNKIAQEYLEVIFEK